MTSRERLLTAIACQQPDHVPLYFNTRGFRPPEPLLWSNWTERAEYLLSLGVDDICDVFLEARLHPEVQVRSWREDSTEERYPVMIKEYETPAGTLRQEVYYTEEGDSLWGVPTQALLMMDYNVPRSRRFPVEGEADLPALRYLLQPPEGAALEAFHEATAEMAQACDRLGILLAGWGPLGTDAAVWLCGVENLIYLAMDQPAVFAQLLDIIHEHDKRLIEILLDSPVDLIVRRGWYDHADFWSPALWGQYIAPRLRELTELVHQGGKLMGYVMSTAMGPLLGMLSEIGYDLHYFVDPVQGKADLREVKTTLGRRTALLGGMNSAVTLERGTDDEIRRAVYEAVEILGPGGGFILSPVDCLFPTTPWHSVEVVIEAWREVRALYH